MADSNTADLGKGKRITGGDRTSLADDLRKRYDGGESIRSLATSTNRSYGFVHRLLSESGADRPERIRNLILPSRSIEYARDRARQLVDRARGALTELPDSEARRVLDVMDVMLDGSRQAIAHAAVIVASALGGRRGLRAYLGRVLVWRVHPAWYLAVRFSVTHP